MFCGNCGKEMQDGELFCANCGAKVDAVAEEPIAETPAPAEEAAPVAEEAAPVAEEAAPVAEEAAPVAEEAAPVEDYTIGQPEVQAKPKKKISKKVITIASVVAAVAVVAALIIFNFNVIVGYFIKWFGSDEDYLVFVAKNNYAKAFNTATGTVSDINDDFQNKTVTSNISVELGEDLLDLAEQYTGYELGWINDAKVSVTSGNYKDFTKMGLALMMDKKDVVSMEAIFDYKEGAAYIGLPALTKEYLEMDLEELGITDEMLDTIANSEELNKAMPSEKELNKLFEKYLVVAFEQLEVDKMETVKEEVEGVKDSYTLIECSISEQTGGKIVVAILKELANDKEAKKMLQEALDAVAEQADLPEGVLDQLDVDDLFDQIDAVLEMAEASVEDLDDEEIARVGFYVNGVHEIVGYDVEVLGEEVFYSLYAESGSKWASVTEVYAPQGTVSIEGSGKRSWGKKSGEVTISADAGGLSLTVLEAELEKIDEGKAKEGRLDGTIRIRPGSAVLKMIGDQSGVSSLLGAGDPCLELIFVDKNNNNKVTVNLLLDDELYAGVTLETKVSGNKKISAPKKTVDANDSEDLMDWVGGMDFDPIIKALEKAGVDDDIIESLEDAIDMVS